MAVVRQVGLQQQDRVHVHGDFDAFGAAAVHGRPQMILALAGEERAHGSAISAQNIP